MMLRLFQPWLIELRDDGKSPLDFALSNIVGWLSSDTRGEAVAFER